MFGTFRLILAICVVIHHLAPLNKFNIGVAAVINFFIISGYVMTVLIKNNYGKIGKSTLFFYADRFLRIYPQFFFFLVLSQIGDLLWRFDAKGFLEGDPSFFKFILNALIVPMNYFQLSSTIGKYQLIPPAWSLGLEEQFYWIFPFLVLIFAVERVAVVTSLVIFILAIFGVFNPELFAFRLLPGVIFIFLLGKNLADYNHKQSKEALWSMILLYLAVLEVTIGTAYFAPVIYGFGQTLGVIGGVLVGFPIIVVLSRLKRQKWDDILGHCSYGVFLSHILIKDTFMHFELYHIFNTIFVFVVAVIVSSIIAGYIGYYGVEKLVNPFRFRLRKKHAISE